MPDKRVLFIDASIDNIRLSDISGKCLLVNTQEKYCVFAKHIRVREHAKVANTLQHNY